MRKAVFLDRDGTIIEDVCHLHRIEDIRILPGVPEAIRRLNEVGWLVIVVTNQSVVARGLLSEDQLKVIHKVIDKRLANRGARIDAWYYCPHHPGGIVREYSIECECRKPKPGMLLRAAREYDITLECSWMVGDKQSDVECGSRLGLRSIQLGRDVSSLSAAVSMILMKAGLQRSNKS